MKRKIIGNPGATNERMKRMVRAVRIDESTLTEHGADFRERVIAECQPSWRVLDCGKAMREYSDALAAKISEHEILDIEDFDNNPDIIADLCEPISDPELKERYDAVVCIAVLEHCYDPLSVCRNLHYMLKPGGTLFGYVPWMFQYHAADNLDFQDYWRFSKDALAYAFRDWEALTLFPKRGGPSAALNLLVPFWKSHVERYGVNRYIDGLVSQRRNVRQASGYHFIAVK